MLTNLKTLSLGFHTDRFFPHNRINVTELHGVRIVHQWDARGPQHATFYDFVTVDFNDGEHKFNDPTAAMIWIEYQLDCYIGNDPMPEPINTKRHWSQSGPRGTYYSGTPTWR